jgi:hypothetical protein
MPRIKGRVYVMGEMLVMHGNYGDLTALSLLSAWSGLKMLNLIDTNIRCSETDYTFSSRVYVVCLQDSGTIDVTVMDTATMDTTVMGIAPTTHLSNYTLTGTPRAGRLTYEHFEFTTSSPILANNSTNIITANIAIIGSSVGAVVILGLLIASIVGGYLVWKRRRGLRTPIYTGMEMPLTFPTLDYEDDTQL